MPAPALAAQWTAPSLLSSESYATWARSWDFRQLSLAGDGTLVAALGDRVFRKAPGAGFDAGVQVRDSSTLSYAPRIAVQGAPSGSVTAWWKEDGFVNVGGLTAGGLLTPMDRLDPDTTVPRYIQSASAPSGAVAVVGSSHLNSGGDGRVLRAAVSVPGERLGPPLVVSESFFTPSVAVNDAGQAVVAWYVSGVAETYVFASKYDPATRTWSEPTGRRAPGYRYAPAVVVDPRGTAYVVTQHGSVTSRPEVLILPVGGAAIVEVLPAAVAGWDVARLAVEPDGALTVSRRWHGRKEFVVWSRSPAGTWTRAAAPGSGHEVTVSRRGDVVVTWTGADGHSFAAIRRPGEGFGVAQRLGTRAQDGWVAVRAAGNGDIVVVRTPFCVGGEVTIHRQLAGESAFEPQQVLEAAATGPASGCKDEVRRGANIRVAGTYSGAAWYRRRGGIGVALAAHGSAKYDVDVLTPPPLPIPRHGNFTPKFQVGPKGDAAVFFADSSGYSSGGTRVVTTNGPVPEPLALAFTDAGKVRVTCGRAACAGRLLVYPKAKTKRPRTVIRYRLRAGHERTFAIRYPKASGLRVVAVDTRRRVVGSIRQP